MLAPSRVPPGRHTVVVRLDRADFAGGKADFLYTVDFLNPEYGAPLVDPAWRALREAHGGRRVQLVSLRRCATPAETEKGFPDETVVPTEVHDNYMMSNSAHWDSKIANRGDDPNLQFGTPTGSNAPTRSLVQFDLSALPREARILGAQLRLALVKVPHVGTGPDGRITAYAVRRPWNEVPKDGRYCTWYGPFYAGNKRTSTDPTIVFWKKGGCDDPEEDRHPNAAGVVEVGDFPARSDAKKGIPGERRRLVAMDVTSTVRDWHDGRIANHGLVLVYSGKGWVNACSSEHTDYPLRPTLVIAYEAPPPKGRQQ